MFLIRNLVLAAAAAFSVSAWSQTQPGGWPQLFFWQANPYLMQPSVWTFPPQFFPPLQPQTAPQNVPFPTPFWLWPSHQRMPQVGPLPSAPTISLPAQPALPAAAPMPMAATASPPTPVPEPAQVASPVAASSPTPAAEKPTAPVHSPMQTTVPSATAPVETHAARTEADIGVAAPLAVPLTAPLATPEAIPAPTAEIRTKVSTVSTAPVVKTKTFKKVPATTKKRPAGKPRKLCWKDGRLDICP